MGLPPSAAVIAIMFSAGEERSLIFARSSLLVTLRSLFRQTLR